MKILVLSELYPSTVSEVPGIFVRQQVRELRKQGCEVRVISPTPLTPFPVKYISRKWRAYSQVPPEMTWDGVEVHYPRYLSFPRNGFLASSGKRMYWGIKKLVEELYRDFKFDIIHAHVALPDGYAGMMVKRQYGRPLVVTIHGADMQTTIHRDASCKTAIAKVFQQADKIVTVCTKLRRIAEANLGFQDKPVVINNGINPEDIVSDDVDLPSTYAANMVVLSVSHLIASKGLDLNLKAISQLAGKYPNLKYLVIGGGPEAESLKQLADSLNLGDRVEFLGEMPHEEVMRYMAAADLLSMPSAPEAFAMVYLEAMAHGKPVIACQGQGITDIVEDGETGLLVKSRDVPSLVQAMDFLLGNPEKAQKIGEKARKVVLEKCTWEKNVRKYMEIYEELLRTRG